MKAGKVSFGADSVEETIKKGKVKLVILSEESSDRTKEKFKEICIRNKIPIIIYETIQNLSKAIGKNNKAIIAIKDANLSKSILEKYNGGDIIG